MFFAVQDVSPLRSLQRWPRAWRFVASVSVQEYFSLVDAAGLLPLPSYIKQQDTKDLSSRRWGSVLDDPVQFSLTACFAPRDNPSSELLFSAGLSPLPLRVPALLSVVSLNSCVGTAQLFDFAEVHELQP